MKYENCNDCEHINTTEGVSICTLFSKNISMAEHEKCEEFKCFWCEHSKCRCE